ncbi:ferredoxin-NADP reductase [Glaciihabitans tibetensis]|uniref:Ferredoxin-NADP reductase n=1 Tax=Glaciihabitans tibetensis TaxID=1266600 RepID=A0A2T0VFV4_9MICO|nr:PDR/VanB family oxidoreductase [Glaciihabitans tibetensis]PRY69075.1 ferredoxin-NADP reductase [Glaciihabitans tibetensis]
MSFFSDVERGCVVESRRDVASGVVLVTLTSVNGRELPPWTPGSHIDLILTGLDGAPLERQYSLCGDPNDRTRYQVAVLREDSGRGGSAAIHQNLIEGATLRIRGPRNHFGFDARPGSPVLFIAGGIGITPLLTMSREAAAAGVDYAIVYLGRSRSTMAFLPELHEEHGPRLRVYARDEGDRADLSAIVAELPPATRVYSCGPTGLLDALDDAWTGRPVEQLHVERFEAREFGEPVWQDSFEVELAMTGVTVEVPLGRSILDMVEENGVLVVSSCRTGTCGTCQTPVLEGEIEHRDSVLTPGEQEHGDTMMICVSRAACPRLVLDL